MHLINRDLMAMLTLLQKNLRKESKSFYKNKKLFQLVVRVDTMYIMVKAHRIDTYNFV